MPGYLPLTQKLVEFPTVHSRQPARLAKGKNPALVKRQSKFLPQLALLFGWGQAQRIGDIFRNFYN